MEEMEEIEESVQEPYEGDSDILVSPPSSTELINAKAFLMTSSSTTRFNLYDHLSALLCKILRERIIDAVDCFEDISRKVKDDRYDNEKSFIEKPAENSDVLIFVQRMQSLMQAVIEEKLEISEEAKTDEEHEIAEELALQEHIGDQLDAEQIDSAKDVDEMEDDIPNLCNNMLYFNQTGFGFGKEETFKLTLALKMLAKTYGLKQIYFWGKILGMKYNYYIAEVNYKEGLEDDENAWIDKEEIQQDTDTGEIKQEEDEIQKDKDETQEDIIEGNADMQENLDTADEMGKSEVEEQEANEANIIIAGDETGKEEEDIIQEIKAEEEFEEIIMPTPHYEPPHSLPTEDNGMGINKYVYFVCSELGLPWKRLPNVTPSQIVAARMIKKIFTGDLMTQVSTYPPFPGKEAHYLRAQIARISSSTHISPFDYYYFESPVQPEQEIQLEGNVENIDIPNEVLGGEGKGEESILGEVAVTPKVSELKINYVRNPNYKPFPVDRILKDGLEAWVHHKQYIMNQGRCTWYEHVEKPSEEINEAENLGDQVDGEIAQEEPKPELEEKAPEYAQEEGDLKDTEQPENVEPQEEIKPEKEIPIPLLKPISMDKGLDTLPAWTTHNPSNLLPQFGVAVVRSVNWPGAYAFTNGKIFGNIYIGFGQKFSLYHFSPPLPSDVQQEYLFGPEIIEHESEIPVIIEEKKEEELVEAVISISMDIPSESGEQWDRGTQTDLDVASDEIPHSTETVASEDMPQSFETEASEEIVEEILPEDT